MADLIKIYKSEKFLKAKQTYTKPPQQDECDDVSIRYFHTQVRRNLRKRFSKTGFDNALTSVTKMSTLPLKVEHFFFGRKRRLFR